MSVVLAAWFLPTAAAIPAEALQTPSPVPTAPPAQPTIVDARNILALTPEAAASRIPCRIRGVVTCSARRGDLLFVQDATAGVYVYSVEFLPRQGTLVEVSGSTDKGLFAPILVAETLVELGPAELPNPRPIAIEDMAFGRHDSQWVEIEGIVTRQEVSWGHILLSVSSGSARVDVRVIEFDPARTVSWVDARVRIRGVAGTSYNDRRQLTGFHLLTQSASEVSILREPPADAFALPVRTSRSLMSYASGGGSEHRVHLRGVVTWAWPGHGFFLRDESGDVRISCSEPASPAPGDIVDAIGFPRPSISGPLLEDALFRNAGHADPPSGSPATAAAVIAGTHENQLISVDATVLRAEEDHGTHKAIVLEDGPYVFRARYLPAWPMPSPSALNGSRIRVTGVCTPTPNTPGVPASVGFSIWMRNDSDLTILQHSTGSRQRVALIILGTLSGAILIGGTWIILLRSRVRSQTEEIRKRESHLEERYLDLFENANDIIYSHDLDGIITSVNRAGCSLLERPVGELIGRNIESILVPEDVPISRKHFQAKLAGETRTTYEIRALTGRSAQLTLEVNSRLLYKDGRPVGVQGIARDITERKEAEEALRSSERQLRASLDERERLGHDLHDGIIQSLYASGLNLNHCARILRSHPETVEERLRSTTHEFNRIIRDVRNFISRLEQDPLTGHEFKTALQSLALSVGGRNSAHVHLDISDDAAARLRSNQASHFLNIAREAMSNSIRHGHARNIRIFLHSDGGALRFRLEDDGIGFNPASTHPHGRGLNNIAARADRLGARLNIDSRPQAGTRISLELGTTETPPS